MSQRVSIALALAAFTSFFLFSVQAEDWLRGLGSQDEPFRSFSHPSGAFSFPVPNPWMVEPTGSQSAQIRLVHHATGFGALITVESVSVPSKTSLSHFAERHRKIIKKRVTGYKLLETDRIRVGEWPAERSWFTHKELGNMDLTDEVVQVALIAGDFGYLITIETAANARGFFWPEFEVLCRGFQPREGTTTLPSNTPLKSAIPKKDELIDPAKVPY